MAGRNKEPLEDITDLELKGLKLDLIDLVKSITGNADANYIPYMSMYEEDLKSLVGLPVQEQRKGLLNIARKVIT